MRNMRAPVSLALIALISCTSEASGPKRPEAPQAAGPSALPWVAVGAPEAAPGLRFGAAGARLAGVESEVVAADGVARVRTTLTLENPGKTPLRGAIEAALPEDTIGAAWEGRRAAEEDVALRPGTRRFRSAPVELAAGQKREIVLEHAVALARAATPVLVFGRLAGATPQVRVVGAEIAAQAEGDLTLRGTDALAGQTAETAPSAVRIALDTSAARAFDLEAEVALVRAVAARWPAAHLSVAAYDLAAEPLYDGPASGLDGALARRVAERGALGSSDVTTALRWAAEGRSDLTLVVADGRDVEPLALLQPDAKLRPDATTRLRFVLPPSGARDEEALATLAGQLTREPSRPVALSRGLEHVLFALPVDAPRPWLDPPRWLSVGEPAPPTRPHSRTIRDALLAGARPLPPLSVQAEELDPLEDLKARPAVPAEEPVTVEPAKSEPGPKAHANELASGAIPDAAQAEPAPQGRPQIPPDTIRGIVRRNFARFRGCYVEALHRDPRASGRLVIRFDIEPSGTVSLARAVESSVRDVKLTVCVVRGFEALSFPASPSGAVTVSYPIVFQKGDPNEDASGKRAGMPPLVPSDSPLFQPPKEGLTGEPEKVLLASQRGDAGTARSVALALLDRDRGDAAGYEIYGDALAAAGDAAGAARAYASVADLDQPGALRRAAARLSGLGEARGALALALASRAVAANPDDVAAYRLVAALLARGGDPAGALATLDAALARRSEALRSQATRELLRGDLGLFARAELVKQPDRKIRRSRWLADVGATVDGEPSVHFSASWGGASDVDLVVADRGQTEATKRRPFLPTGGRLLGDTKGFGASEAFVLDGETASRDYPYQLKVALDASDEALVSGTVEVLEGDASGAIVFTTHPFVLNVVGGRVDVATVEGPLPASAPKP